MAEIIRVEDLKVSDDEKKLIIRALTDKTFRETLEKHVSSSGGELSDAELADVAGGNVAIASLNKNSVREVLSISRSIIDRLHHGAQVLCGGAPSPCPPFA